MAYSSEQSGVLETRAGASNNWFEYAVGRSSKKLKRWGLSIDAASPVVTLTQETGGGRRSPE
ncbi:MAG TPA: hypothetical protein VK901_11000, partial [Nitrospiraceae bacterium]|nr:hypothetical protein [Nitrospiraceae bacterium]